MRDRAGSEDACDGPGEVEHGAFESDRAGPAVEDGDDVVVVVEFFVDVIWVCGADAV